jgi:hypothetical protein
MLYYKLETARKLKGDRHVFLETFASQTLEVVHLPQHPLSSNLKIEEAKRSHFNGKNS